MADRITTDKPTCWTCHSRPRLAYLKCQRAGGEVVEVERYIVPCDPSRHDGKTNMVAYPSNFAGWAEPAR